MQKESLNFLKELIGTISPSGFEEEAAKLWKEQTKKFAGEIKSDAHGNSIAVLNGNEKIKVMLAGHIDEIGYMVKYIDKKVIFIFHRLAELTYILSLVSVSGSKLKREKFWVS